VSAAVEAGSVVVGCVLGLQGLAVQGAFGSSYRSDHGGSTTAVSDLVGSGCVLQRCDYSAESLKTSH
jgi:hypothetical protein